MFSTITYIKISQSGSPGLVVKGGDSLSKGCEFESIMVYWMNIFHIPICCRICNVCLNKRKINEKEAGVGPFLRYYRALKPHGYIKRKTLRQFSIVFPFSSLIKQIFRRHCKTILFKQALLKELHLSQLSYNIQD